MFNKNYFILIFILFFFNEMKNEEIPLFIANKEDQYFIANKENQYFIAKKVDH